MIPNAGLLDTLSTPRSLTDLGKMTAHLLRKKGGILHDKLRRGVLSMLTLPRIFNPPIEFVGRGGISDVAT